MPELRTCSRCGAPLPADTADGHCLACLLRLGLQQEDESIGTGVEATKPRTASRPADGAPAWSEKPGDRIGRYKLLQEIGEGGCGVVYMAEQQEPVKRRVALKVIKPGMDTRQVLARFEAERQALALMDHPNIAKVLDAGATETGRPFFVMELVRGTRITDYCDQNNLSTDQRLGLFMRVCKAIQHAHQKGIIHRDIKPSNILVTVQEDGTAAPKVIDFGIAKATGGQALTDKTLFTAFEQFIGTPAYMSPEQAEMTAIDIDTRSDIYSLGVLLYELLTGRTPFDSKRLVQAGLEGIRRIIREEEPPRPSTRLNALSAAEQTTVAGRRQSNPPQLVNRVCGDLDWIAMKCLEKDRTRRYETANGLGMDIERHLKNEPVAARPPGRLYRLRKFVRRNRLTVAAVGGIAAALVVALCLSTWLWLAERRTRLAEAEMRKMMEFFRETQIFRTVLPNEHIEPPQEATNRIPSLVPPGDGRLSSRTYSQWAAAWWRWWLELPLTNAAGATHPGFDNPRFDASEGQTGDVWFLGAPFGTTQRQCRIPAGKALFFPLFCVESSNLEEPPFFGSTADDQAARAHYLTDHVVDVFCVVDGIALSNLGAYRTASPQIGISVPAPWIQGKGGRKGTSSGDGYFVYLAPLEPGEHTLRFGGAIRFTRAQDGFEMHEPLDITYRIVVP